jgi:hypothetical protein
MRQGSADAQNGQLFCPKIAKIGQRICNNVHLKAVMIVTNFLSNYYRGCQNGITFNATFINTRVAGFLLVQHTKTDKMYQNGGKYTKWP